MNFYKQSKTKTGATGVILNEYKGIYRLCEGFKSDNPDFKNAKMNFAFPSMGDNKPSGTAVPMGVNLGTKEEAIKLLKNLIFELS